MSWWNLALSQKTYQLVGDIDDCWVIASIYAVRRHTRQTTNLPSARKFRIAAGDPDDGYRDGGTVHEIDAAIKRLWPHVDRVKFTKQYGWSGLEAYLDRGFTASIALRSSYLPSAYRYNFLGTHQVALYKSAGKWYVMNPLQATGTSPRVIAEADIKRAVYAFANGWVMAELIRPINLGTFAMTKTTLPRSYRRYYRNANGTWGSELRATRGWSATACPPEGFSVSGKYRQLVFISSGMNAGYYVEYAGKGRSYTP